MFPSFSKKVLYAILAASLIAAVLIGLRIVDLFPLPPHVTCSVAHFSTLRGFYSNFKNVFVSAYEENIHGVNVRNVANVLNTALQLIRKFRKTHDTKYLELSYNELVKACALLSSDVKHFREVQNRNNIATAIAVALVPSLVYVIASVVAPWLYVRFKLWYFSIFEVVPEEERRRRGGEEEEERRTVRKSILMDEETLAVVVAICIVVSVFVVAYVVTHSKVTEPFSAIGLLGPTKKIGGYPTVVYPGEKFLLWVYLFDYEGKIMWYRVLIKLGNRTTFINSTVPAHASVIDYVEACLAHNESTLIPVWLSIAKPGSYKLIFEVWYYDVSKGRFVYKGIWTHIYINVTRR